MAWWTPTEDPRARRARSWVADVLVMLFVLLVSLPNAVSDAVGERSITSGAGIALTALALACLPLLVRRIWPVPVFAWVLLISAATGWWYPQFLGFGALVVALYTVCSRCSRRVALTCAGLVVALAVVFAFGIDTSWWAPAILLTAVTAAATAIGLYVGTRRAYLDELRDRADRLQRERDQQTALAAAAERARIAREMHDIVAHHLTVMVALSDGAAAASIRSPERAAEVMATVSATGRQALADTRRLLGVLRDDAGGDADLRPLPTLSDLDELLRRVRDAGLPVRYEVHGATTSIPAGIQLTLYRLVQEALTNTMKHAGPGATATVSVRYATDQVCVEVTDDGGGSPRPASARGPGRGLTGMRDRVSAFGGDVTTGPNSGHGWRVSATMRLDPAVAP